MILPHGFGTWREACAIAADKLVAAPTEIEPIQAAMLKVNPITAWRMLHDFVSLQPGDWLIQNAANSAAGRCVIQIARELGYKTVNIVRRAGTGGGTAREGGDVVLVDGENLRDEVAAATQRAPIRLALNAVGGENALRMAKTLAPDGTMVTYGAMSLQPMCIPNGMLIFKNLRFTGFWVNKWYDGATPKQRAETFAPLFEMAKRGLLRTKVEKTYPLSRSEGRGGPRVAGEARREDCVRLIDRRCSAVAAALSRRVERMKPPPEKRRQSAAATALSQTATATGVALFVGATVLFRDVQYARPR